MITKTPLITHIKSFARHQGRFTPRQQNALQSYSHLYALAPQELLRAEQSFQRNAALILEIGFGMGHALLQMAQEQPEKNFVGIEVYKPGVGALIAGLEEANISNVRIYNADAMLVLPNCFDNHSFDKINIFFPDPWPKNRHQKRRIIQPAFVQLLTQKLKPMGILHLATDCSNYAAHMQQVLANEPGLEKNAEWSGRLDRPSSKYEARGQRLGHEIFDVIFSKRKNSFVFPAQAGIQES